MIALASIIENLKQYLEAVLGEAPSTPKYI